MKQMGFQMLTAIKTVVTCIEPRVSNKLTVIFCPLYFRCGADTSIKNIDGLTAEEVLLKERPDGWEENLHWYNKFKPGVYDR